MIDAESAGLQAEMEMASRALLAGDRTAQLQSAEELLSALRARLEDSISPELKRRIVEALVEKVEANTVEKWGVQQSEITISYRFGQPDEAAALVLPKLHRMSNRNRCPDELKTIGDHLLRRRLMLKLLQREVADKIGVNVASIRNWESSLSTPSFEYIPAIFRFLGYNPFPPAEKWSERLVQCRTILGISQKESARRMGVDPCTLARGGRGEREPSGKFANTASSFLISAGSQWSINAAIA